MKEKWFKAKEYGWGWTPATWQGWTVVFLYALIIFFLFFSIDGNSYSAFDTLFRFIPMVVVLSCILIAIGYITGEKPEWRWGEKPKKARKR